MAKGESSVFPDMTLGHQKVAHNMILGRRKSNIF